MIDFKYQSYFNFAQVLRRRVLRKQIIATENIDLIPIQCNNLYEFKMSKDSIMAVHRRKVISNYRGFILFQSYDVFKIIWMYVQSVIQIKINKECIHYTLQHWKNIL